MLSFPVLAFAIALIAIGRGASSQFFEERRRDEIARKVFLGLGITVLVCWFFL